MKFFGAKESFLFIAECCFFDAGIIQKRLFDFFVFFSVKIALKQTKLQTCTYNCNLCHLKLFFFMLSSVHFAVIFLTFVLKVFTCYKLLMFCKSTVVSSLLQCQSWLQRMFAYGTIFVLWHNGRILNTILNKQLNQWHTLKLFVLILKVDNRLFYSLFFVWVFRMIFLLSFRYIIYPSQTTK